MASGGSLNPSSGWEYEQVEITLDHAIEYLTFAKNVSFVKRSYAMGINSQIANNMLKANHEINKAFLMLYDLEEKNREVN